MPEISLTRDGAVAVLTLDAPERRNALTLPMARELVAACEAIDADDAVGAVVLRGEGRSFCAGGARETLRAVGQPDAPPEAVEELRALYASFVRVGALRAPVVAAVAGAAVGAGLNLALAADLRIVARDARIFAGFHRIGLHPGGGHFTLLERVAGREAAIALGVFDEELDGDRAVALGLAWAAVPRGEVDARALEIAQRVADDPVLARSAIATARRELGPPRLGWAAGLDLETPAQVASLRRAVASGRLPE
jgi:enoyl-CoA hydratase